MTEDQMTKIAITAMDRLGDVCSGDDDPETIAEEAFTLAHDALVDAGVEMGKASEIASITTQSMFGVSE